MKKSALLFIPLIIFLVIAGITLLNDSNKQETEPIRIGFIGPLTGDASSIGTVNKAAVEIAVEEINQSGGIDGRQLDVVYEDGKCDAQTAVNAANKLMNIDQVSVIIGGLCSTETSAFGPLAMQKNIIVFSYGSSAPSLSKLGKYFFRSYPSDSYDWRFAAEYIFNTMKKRNVAIVYHITEWGTGLKDVFEKRFKELGGEIVVVEGTTQESRDYRTILNKVKNSNPELIYAPAYPEGSTILVKQAQELGISIPLFGASAWADPKFQKDASGKGTLYLTEQDTELSEEFKQKILAKTGGDQVPLGTAQAYDNVKILAKIIERVGTDTDRIQEELRKVKFNGISGPISFDQNGDLKTARYVVKEIRNGKSEPVE